MLVYQTMIERADLRANPLVLYLFGDNAQRWGNAGQAGAMRGEPNACGIRTKWVPSTSFNSYFEDKDLPIVTEMWDEDFDRPIAHHRAGGVVICPLHGLGTGLSLLNEKRVPMLHLQMQAMLGAFR